MVNVFHRTCLVSLLLAFLFLKAGAQVKLPNYLPPSPNAASLGKFADVPVGLYSGTPIISVPIYEVTSGKLKLPISLSYHASGIKVEEIASWVGLGWALNAGGVITRTVRGAADDSNIGILMDEYKVPPNFDPDNASSVDYAFFERYANGDIDSQPDMFFYNFAGNSGKFVLDSKGKVHTIPKQKVKFVFQKGHLGIISWEVTAIDGVRYQFSAAERTKTVAYSPDSKYSPSQAANSAWYLTRIISPTQDSIEFQYSKYSYPGSKLSPSETKYIVEGQFGSEFVDPDNPQPYKVMMDKESQVDMVLEEGKRLRKIIFSDGEVEFFPGRPRHDLMQDSVLDKIEIRDKAGKIRSAFNLKYGYLSGTSIEPIESFPPALRPDYNVRLMLLSVQESIKDPAETVAKPPYVFSYHTMSDGAAGMPGRMSKQQDHWGYFNGKWRNTTLVPAEVHYNPIFKKSIFLFGADRSVDLSATRVGTLEKMTLPTGGYWQYTYEQNDCVSNLLYKKMVPGPGLRVSSNVKEAVSYTPFTIQNPDGAGGAYLTFIFENFPCLSCPPLANGNDRKFRILGLDKTTEFFTTLGNTQLDLIPPFYLPNGNYLVELTKDAIDDPYSLPIFTMKVDWLYEVADPNKLVGGLRIKKVIAYDPISKQKLIKRFEYKNQDGQSSGSILGVPEYGHDFKEDHYTKHRDGGVWYLLETFYYIRQSNSQTPLGTTQGNHVGYGMVTVFHGEQGENGKTVNQFTSPKEFPDAYDLNRNLRGRSSNNSRLEFPYAPPDSRDWLRGLPTWTADYKNSNGSFILIKDTFNQYNFFTDTESGVETESKFLGVKADYTYRSNQGPNVFVRKTKMKVAYFRTRTGYYELAKTTERVFDQEDASKSVSSSTNYVYSPNHHQVISAIQTASDARKLVTQTTYPADYTDATGFIHDLQAAHIHHVPIEKVVYQTDTTGQNPEILSGQITTYKTGGRGLAAEILALEAGKPIVLPNFKFSNQPAGVLPMLETKGIFSPDSAYKRKVVFETYDAGSNAEQLRMEGDVPVVLIWAYNKKLPIAEVKNADLGKVEEVHAHLLTHARRLGQDVPAPAVFDNYLVLDRDQSITYSYTPALGGSVSNVVFRLWIKDLAGKSWEYQELYNTNKTFTLFLPAGTYAFSYMADLNPDPSPGSSGNLDVVVRIWYQSTTVRQKVFHTSFEEDGIPDAQARTGNKIFKGAYSFPLPVQTGKYLLTYWRRPTGSQDWEYVSEVVDVTLSNASKDIGARGVELDEVRFYPVGAQMTTYTYDPLIGMTTTTDANNLTTNYSYDDFGRLSLIRDSNGNIIKSYKYNYRKN